MPNLSIIIPAYNVQDNIYNTLNSLLNQTDSDFETILVNDGSIDNTFEVVEDILSKSNFTNYKIINKENGGVSSARNVGIREANGKYLYFLDGDDYVTHDMVSKVKSHISNDYPDIIAWGYDMVNENGTVLTSFFDKFSKYKTNSQKLTGIEALEDILLNKTFWIWTCSAAYKKEFITQNNLLYTEGCTNGEDQEFTFKALSKAKEVIFVDKVLSFYVQREGSISNSYNIKRFDVVDAFERVADYIKMNANNKADMIVNYVANKHLVDNYFYVFNSCSRYIISSEKLLAVKKFNFFINEINKIYPGLTIKIKKKIKSMRTADLKTRVKYHCYLISPLLYMFLFSLYIKILDKKAS